MRALLLAALVPISALALCVGSAAEARGRIRFHLWSSRPAAQPREASAPEAKRTVDPSAVPARAESPVVVPLPIAPRPVADAADRNSAVAEPVRSAPPPPTRTTVPHPETGLSVPTLAGGRTTTCRSDRLSGIGAGFCSLN